MVTAIPPAYTVAGEYELRAQATWDLAGEKDEFRVVVQEQSMSHKSACGL
jgi:uncharacterized membrane protein